MKRVVPGPIFRKSEPVSSNVELAEPLKLLTGELDEVGHVVRIDDILGEGPYIIGARLLFRTDDLTDHFGQSLSVTHAKPIGLCD